MLYRLLLLAVLVLSALIVSAENNRRLLPVTIDNGRLVVAYDDPDRPTEIDWYEVTQKVNDDGSVTLLYLVVNGNPRTYEDNLSQISCYSTVNETPSPLLIRATPDPTQEARDHSSRSSIQSQVATLVPKLQNAACSDGRRTVSNNGQNFQQCSLNTVSIDYISKMANPAVIESGQRLEYAGGEFAGFDQVQLSDARPTPYRVYTSLIPDPQSVPFRCNPDGVLLPPDAADKMSISPLQFRFTASPSFDLQNYFLSELSDWTVKDALASGGLLFTKDLEGETNDQQEECHLQITIDGQTVYGSGSIQPVDAATGGAGLPMGPVSTIMPDLTVEQAMMQIQEESQGVLRPELTLRNDTRGFFASVSDNGVERYHTFYQLNDGVWYLRETRPAYCSLKP